MNPRMTYTVATLGVPKILYEHIAGRLRASSYGHAFGVGDMIDMSGIALEVDPDAKLEDWHMNTKYNVAVSDVQYWQPMSTCPRGAGVQLLNGYGVPTYGTYDGDPQWVGWAPKPQIPAGLIPKPQWQINLIKEQKRLEQFDYERERSLA